MDINYQYHRGRTTIIFKDMNMKDNQSIRRGFNIKIILMVVSLAVIFGAVAMFTVMAGSLITFLMAPLIFGFMAIFIFFYLIYDTQLIYVTQLDNISIFVDMLTE